MPQLTYPGHIGGTMVRPATALTTVKFNPGYYWAALMGSGPSADNSMYGVLNWPDIKTEVNATNNALRGALLRFGWREIETSKGVYTAAGIKKAHNEMAALSNGPKKVAIMFELRSTATDAIPGLCVPDYIDTESVYQGGTYLSGSTNTKGNINRYMRLWVPEIVERLKLVADFLASELDGLPHFEMLQFSEPIIGAAMDGEVVPAGYNSTNSNANGSYAKGMRDTILYFNQKFQQTIVTQLLNYPQALNTNYIPVLRDAGVGISCPNSMKDEPGLVRTTGEIGIWPWMQRTDAQKVHDVTIVAPHIQKPECYYSNMSFDNPSLDGLGTKPGENATPPYGVNGAKEIVDFAKTGHPNYIFITRAPMDTRPNVVNNNPNGIIYTDWLDFLRLPAQMGNAAGGLNDTLPSKLAP